MSDALNFLMHEGVDKAIQASKNAFELNLLDHAILIDFDRVLEANFLRILTKCEEAEEEKLRQFTHECRLLAQNKIYEIARPIIAQAVEKFCEQLDGLAEEMHSLA